VGSLVLSGVARSFGNVTAVRDVSFEVSAGTTFGLLGPNGAGKTTTMRMILGILPPDRGTVRWNGEPVDLAVRRRFGYLPEERGLYAKLKVRDHIAYFGRLHGIAPPANKAGADRWIERLGLGEYANRPCGELSKGNQQKVQIACAALHKPELLILDEPFSGLDPINAETLLGALRELKAGGATLILSSHQMWQIEDLCERFCIIADGTVQVAGTLAELRASWPTRVVEVEPPAPALRAVLDRVPGARALGSGDRPVLAYEVPANADVAAIVRALVAAGDVTRFERVEPRLSDIYLRAIEGGP
jgi:ABC-2 type transport system ATP-binding protein